MHEKLDRNSAETKGKCEEKRKEEKQELGGRGRVNIDIESLGTTVHNSGISYYLH